MANRTMDIVSPNRAQSSLYNLTLDEVQSQLGNTGNPLHSMNLDELPNKGVISVESSEQQQQQQLVQNPSASPSDWFPQENNIGNLNETLVNNKTNINDVWRGIVHQEHLNTSMNNHLQQSSLGGTALEEFLASTRVINYQDNVCSDSKPLMAVDPMAMASQGNWLPLQMQLHMQVPSIQQQQHQEIIGMCPDLSVSNSVFENKVMKFGYSGDPLAISMPMATMSSSTCSDFKEVGRKRMSSDEMLEKSIERRQKRMAKNRESAAKSRAKKQAYIEQLEHAKTRLLNSNSWLKKLKDAETQLLSSATLNPKYQLRRTSSNTF